MFNIKIDSRKVVPGDTFVATCGKNVDGHDYISDAIKRGAVKVIASYGEYSVDTVIVGDVNSYITNYLVDTYKSLFEKIHFIGVTGTNGKTSTAYIAYQMLKELGENAAYIGTIGYIFGDVHEDLENTTPNIVELYNLIVNAYESGAEYIVMEVSSHALDLKRTEGINFDVCGFTNLTQDHLDYHVTMENYLNAKLKIIDCSDKMIINNDDEYAGYFMQKEYSTIGFKDATFLIDKYEVINRGTKIYFSYKNHNYGVLTNLIGKFNIYNYMMALAICSNYFPVNNILGITDKIVAPHGRCDVIKCGEKSVVVDYAHTPDAVEKIINVFTENKVGKVITVIGCGGNRDKSKRPIMGKIATEGSDYVIFTSDNPRCEDENLIIEDIIKGVYSDNYEIVVDRREAIKKSIEIASLNDVVLILGKGHEDYQIIGNTKHHFSDKEEILKCINIKS